MYEIKTDRAIEEHQDDLVSLSAALKAAQQKGRLDDDAAGLAAELDAHVEEGDALADQRRREGRARVVTQAELRVEESVQEEAVEALFKDCMKQADLNRQAPLVRDLFEGGVHAMMTPALEAQNEAVGVLVGKLETQDQYAGALRAEHVPTLQQTIDDAEALLKARAQHERAREHLAAKELAWKQHSNALRVKVGGWLMQQGVARQHPSPKRFAHDFFAR